uniref:U6 small nuclear RNA (adenine-(43)-N(6))-methyltransferase n=1 Tax=Arcella intermedia TaxID=1963864 RepID=A0A6B2L5D9_9EUKA
MHQNSVYYNNPPNFEEIALKHPPLQPHLIRSKGTTTIDWKNEDSQRELTKALLSVHFNVKIELSPTNLCPTVTSRSNYIYWINDLLNGSPSPSPGGDEKKKVIGIDIGTGASCIYPLLGASIYGWDFLGTDIDPASLEYAIKNVALNDWNDKIQTRLVQEGSILLNNLKDNESFDFCMCNPPFFDSLEQKVDNPKTVCEATLNELVTVGGELAFISQIIQESLVLKSQVRWYSSMIGRKKNVKKLLNLLKKHKVTNIRSTTFYQGLTTRWAIAWCIGDDGLGEHLKQRLKESVSGKKKMEFTMKAGSLEDASVFLQDVLRSEDICCAVPGSPQVIVGKLYESSKWFETKNAGSVGGKSAVIGPIFPPVLVLTFEIHIQQVISGSFIITLSLKTGEDLDTLSEIYAHLKLKAQKLL